MSPDRARPSVARQRAWVVFGLVIATLLVFSPVLRNGFVSFDDPSQITGNARVAAGVTAEGLLWAFTSFENGNWHPLTWVVHLLTTQIFGPQPAGFHLVSLLFHAATAALLFRFLAGATGRLAPSAFAAGIFALHPLRVESVAWAAELKDPLSGFFFVLALLAYLRFTARPGTGRYLAVAAACACALMAKPTAVTLPLILLLLDWWPLGRILSPTGGTGGASAQRRVVHLVVEKLPLALLSITAAALTLHAQNLSGAVRSYEHPVGVRVGNAAVSLIVYLGKTLWPMRLSFFYPHPGPALALVTVAGAVLLLAALSGVSLREWRTRPYLAAGWMWYLIVVAPMLGVVQAGFQAMADRYTYLPLIGIAVAAALGIADKSLLRALPSAVRWGAAAAFLVFCTALTPLQISRWRDSRTLFTHALALEPDNWLAHLKLGELDRTLGDRNGAVSHLRHALEMNPGDIYARTLLGITLGESGDTDGAIAELREAVRRNQWWIDAYFNLGVALMRAGKLDEAEAAFSRESKLNRKSARSLPYRVYSALGRGKLDEAARHAAAFLQREPRSAKAQILNALVFEAGGDKSAAAAAYRSALTLDPGSPEANAALARLGAAATP